MELNKKLAEWAGFKLEVVVDDEARYWYRWEEGVLCRYNNNLFHFTESLDACFKWFPIPYMKVSKDADCDGKVFYIAVVTMDGLKFYNASDDNTPALSLCKAIEKMMEAEDER